MIGIRIDALPSAVAATNALVIPAMAGGETVKLNVAQILALLVDSAPGTLDTLNELAAALGDDPNFAATVATQLGLKANSASTYTKNEVDSKILSGPQLQGGLHGLTISNNASDATNDIDVSIGWASADTSPYNAITLASILTKRLDAAWSVGSGQGGLDTGAIANATYYVWLIQRSDTGVVDALLSASASAPTMPASYDRKRRVGAILREAGAIAAFTQIGDWFGINTPTNDINTSLATTAAVNETLRVPIGIKVKAKVLVTAAAATTFSVVMSDPAQADRAPSSGSSDSFGGGGSTTAFNKELFTDVSGQIRARTSVNPTTWVVSTQGWYDTRGKG